MAVADRGRGTAEAAADVEEVLAARDAAGLAAVQHDAGRGGAHGVLGQVDADARGQRQHRLRAAAAVARRGAHHHALGVAEQRARARGGQHLLQPGHHRLGRRQHGPAALQGGVAARGGHRLEGQPLGGGTAGCQAALPRLDHRLGHQPGGPLPVGEEALAGQRRARRSAGEEGLRRQGLGPWRTTRGVHPGPVCARTEHSGHRESPLQAARRGRAGKKRRRSGCARRRVVQSCRLLYLLPAGPGGWAGSAFMMAAVPLAPHQGLPATPWVAAPQAGAGPYRATWLPSTGNSLVSPSASSSTAIAARMRPISRVITLMPVRPSTRAIRSDALKTAQVISAMAAP